MMHAGHVGSAAQSRVKFGELADKQIELAIVVVVEETRRRSNYSQPAVATPALAVTSVNVPRRHLL